MFRPNLNVSKKTRIDKKQTPHSSHLLIDGTGLTENYASIASPYDRRMDRQNNATESSSLTTEGSNKTDVTVILRPTGRSIERTKPSPFSPTDTWGQNAQSSHPFRRNGIDRKKIPTITFQPTDIIDQLKNGIRSRSYRLQPTDRPNTKITKTDTDTFSLPTARIDQNNAKTLEKTFRASP